MASKNQRSLCATKEEFTPESLKIGVCYLENLETFSSNKSYSASFETIWQASELLELLRPFQVK